MTDTPRSNELSPVVFMGSGGPDLTAPKRLYTNKNGTAIITPPGIPLHETDIEWVPATRIAELEAKVARQEGWRGGLETAYRAICEIPREIGETKHYWKCQAVIRALAEKGPTDD